MNHGGACKSNVNCSYGKCNKSKLERNKKSGLDWLLLFIRKQVKTIETQAPHFYYSFFPAPKHSFTAPTLFDGN